MYYFDKLEAVDDYNIDKEEIDAIIDEMQKRKNKKLKRKTDVLKSDWCVEDNMLVLRDEDEYFVAVIKYRGTITHEEK